MFMDQVKVHSRGDRVLHNFTESGNYFVWRAYLYLYKYALYYEQLVATYYDKVKWIIKTESRPN